METSEQDNIHKVGGYTSSLTNPRTKLNKKEKKMLKAVESSSLIFTARDVLFTAIEILKIIE